MAKEETTAREVLVAVAHTDAEEVAVREVAHMEAALCTATASRRMTTMMKWVWLKGAEGAGSQVVTNRGEETPLF